MSKYQVKTAYTVPATMGQVLCVLEPPTKKHKAVDITPSHRDAKEKMKDLRECGSSNFILKKGNMGLTSIMKRRGYKFGASCYVIFTTKKRLSNCEKGVLRVRRRYGVVRPSKG